MPEATSERGVGEEAERRRGTQPSAETQSAQEPDREVENYRDEYDFEKHDPRAIDHRSY